MPNIRHSCFLLLAAIVVTPLILIPPSHAKTLKFATIVPDGSTEVQMLRKKLAQVKQLTGGEVDIKIYTNAVAGDEAEVIRKMRTSRVDGGVFTLMGISKIVPHVDLLAYPGLYRDADEAMFVRERLFETFYKDFHEKGYVLLGMFELGTVYAYTNIDFVKEYGPHKLKMFAIKGDWMMESSIRSLGQDTVPLELSQARTALQTGLIDSIASVPFGLTSMQWHPYIRYILDYPLTYLPGAFLFSRASFEAISPQNREILSQYIGNGIAETVPLFRRLNQEAEEILADMGVIRLKMSDRMLRDNVKVLNDSLQKALAEDRYSRTLYDEVQAAIQEYRSGKQ